MFCNLNYLFDLSYECKHLEIKLEIKFLFFLKPIHDIAAEVTAKADVSAMTLILKVLGNAGQPASIKPIKKILSTSAFPLKVQVNAILALKVIAKKEHKQVSHAMLY